eukprot:s4062_g9.t1
MPAGSFVIRFVLTFCDLIDIADYGFFFVEAKGETPKSCGQTTRVLNVPGRRCQRGEAMVVPPAQAASSGENVQIVWQEWHFLTRDVAPHVRNSDSFLGEAAYVMMFHCIPHLRVAASPVSGSGVGTTCQKQCLAGVFCVGIDRTYPFVGCAVLLPSELTAAMWLSIFHAEKCIAVA